MAAYCTADEIRARAGKQFANRDIDAVIAGVSARIKQMTGRAFAEVTDVESKTFYPDRTWYLVVPDLYEVESVTVNGVDVDLSAIFFEPSCKRPIAAMYGPWDVRDEVVVTGRWGYSKAVPDDIRDLCIVLCIRELNAAEAGYADKTASVEYGERVYGGAIPQKEMEIIKRYRRTI